MTTALKTKLRLYDWGQYYEKMLYDNAQLARAYLHAWQLTRDPYFRRIAEATLDFVAREMTHPDGGFYSSLDADSEGVEGKYYVWTKEEVRDALPDASDLEFFTAAYALSEKGNWEGRTVLQRALDDASLAVRFGLTSEVVSSKLSDCHNKLLAIRAQRVRPATDDKILTSWNGLMLATFAEASRVFSDGTSSESRKDSGASTHTRYYLLATRNAEFLLAHLRQEAKLHRSWRDGSTTDEVFLEDFASLILGLLELYQTDFNNKWFTSALELVEQMIEKFSDPQGGFFDTPADGEPLPVRPRDLQDNATPSGNALAADALLKLSALTGRGDLRDIAESSLRLVADLSVRYPTAFGRWLSAAWFARTHVKQVALVTGGDPDSTGELLLLLRADYRPDMVLASTPYPPPANAPELLQDRPLVHDRSTAYVCEGFVCLQPVTTPGELRKLLGTK